MAIVLTHPLEIAILHFLQHGPAVLVVGIYLYHVRRSLCRVVLRAYQLVVGSGIANTGVANVTSDGWLDHPVHFRVGDYRDKLGDMFEKNILGELRSSHKVGGVKLVLVQRVVS